MQLTPSKFECTEHGVDLTAMVHDAVDSQVPVSAFGVHLGQRRRRNAAASPFVVLIDCPGDGGDDGDEGGTAHRLRFSGSAA